MESITWDRLEQAVRENLAAIVFSMLPENED